MYKFYCQGCVEERIIEIGRKKLVLDHLIVESMDSANLDKSELSSIIRFGAEAIFANDDNVNVAGVKYDDEIIDHLLDRDALMKEDLEAEKLKIKGAEDNSFAFAKVCFINIGLDIG